jgi:multimeric flavodoxin WrbA
MRRILALHTSTHDPEESSSAALTRAALVGLKRLSPSAEVKWVNVANLEISPNLSCYAGGKSNCGDPESGPYRCWAHHKSEGRDEMPIVYDGLEWADTVIISTSNRWGSHTAAAQTMIERMNTLENRGSSLGEGYPLLGKRLGIVVTGLHWRTAEVGQRLRETLEWWGFATQPDGGNVLAWQRSRDPFFEHPDNDAPHLERWVLTPRGTEMVESFCSSVARAKTIRVLDGARRAGVRSPGKPPAA